MKEAITHLAKDQILKTILEIHGHPIIQKRDEGFAAMCHIILEQQVSIASAKATYQKLENHFGEITPENILNAEDAELRNCGISRQKTLYLKDLAAKVISKELDFTTFNQKSESNIRAELLKIKGVGNWSVEVYLMFCLQSPDIIPLGDIAIRNTIKELYSIHTVEDMEILAENWKPHRTLASYILWHHYLKKRNKI
ncbi:DNA-3-methyladenine glycosylase family protein [Flavobacterium sp. 3HN19-14]|uniref:DNA-3-methyladenine glycosylase family protein n=1 Tax=Flavobacterium sp. 3HN19-14 TaxID=3448133 RepID=UPI003EE22D0F